MFWNGINVVFHIKVNPGKNIDPISPICICQLRWFEEICVTADVPIMEGREDIEGEQFCAMDEQSCSEIVPPDKVLSKRNSFVQQEK